ncbi:hypothetical protein [Legionella worsleiensis]|uniref:Coiled-coil protein n=1 Tax=Legionella worsleiensis TaxID=45076 RepID=A0A0W1AJV3_9GAMM|nr:hypothetical protein [Legionella worsleiensis]KTD81637.1 hypothetical protein Lwor_0419 [Legionella worsleiensis]STY31954.1 Uncharacterised protein [Legionella worsleiensis]
MEPNTPTNTTPIYLTQDKSIPEHIINLDRNLRGIRAEIDVKIHNFSVYEGKDRVDFLTVLDAIAKELDSAINNLETLVGLANTQSDEEKSAFYQGETMQKLYGIITEKLNKITEIRKKL